MAEYSLIEMISYWPDLPTCYALINRFEQSEGQGNALSKTFLREVSSLYNILLPKICSHTTSIINALFQTNNLPIISTDGSDVMWTWRVPVSFAFSSRRVALHGHRRHCKHLHWAHQTK